jgi:hypothetical protein
VSEVTTSPLPGKKSGSSTAKDPKAKSEGVKNGED